MTILPRFIPSVHCYLVRKPRSTPTSYFYVNTDGEQLRRKARMPSGRSNLLLSGVFGAPQPGRVGLTCGDFTHEKDGGDRG
jgi:hypothetical protein